MQQSQWFGEVAEWLKAPHSKCGVRATVSGVRIPPSPPINKINGLADFVATVATVIGDRSLVRWWRGRLRLGRSVVLMLIQWFVAFVNHYASVAVSDLLAVPIAKP